MARDCLDLQHNQNHLACKSAGTQMALQSCKRPTIALFMCHLTSTTGYHGDGYVISIEDRLLLVEKFCGYDADEIGNMAELIRVVAIGSGVKFFLVLSAKNCIADTFTVRFQKLYISCRRYPILRDTIVYVGLTKIMWCTGWQKLATSRRGQKWP